MDWWIKQQNSQTYADKEKETIIKNGKSAQRYPGVYYVTISVLGM